MFPFRASERSDALFYCHPVCSSSTSAQRDCTFRNVFSCYDVQVPCPHLLQNGSRIQIIFGSPFRRSWLAKDSTCTHGHNALHLRPSSSCSSRWSFALRGRWSLNSGSPILSASRFPSIRGGHIHNFRRMDGRYSSPRCSSTGFGNTRSNRGSFAKSPQTKVLASSTA